MADWLVEEGIAEHRAVRMDGDRIVEARVEWPGKVAPGWVIEASLTSRTAGSSRGTAQAANGEEILVDRLPKGASEGAALRLGVTRAALEGPGRLKRAHARPSDNPLAQLKLGDRLVTAGNDVRVVHHFPANDWDALIDEALTGEVAFAGGTLLFAPTPAMTTIDIDGDLPPRALAQAAVPALATALSRFGLAGSVVIDFPTLPDKADRRAIDTALSEALADRPHERTAMNGFGLVQIVTRLERPSLLHLARWQRAGLIWRRLLRRAESLPGAGSIELAVHPALESALRPDHLAELERRAGRTVKLRPSDDLAFDAPHAQLVPHG